MNPDAPMSPQVAMMHAHPIFWSVVPLVAVIVIISVAILVVWLMRKKAWKFHPGGAGGMLKDEVIRYGSVWLPFAILMVAVRYYIYRFHPEYETSPLLYALYLSVFVFRRLARYLPHVKEIGARIDKARADARAAEEQGAA
jgi:dolichyl-phosphate-mannose--protein O-mannosyl transferase